MLQIFLPHAAAEQRGQIANRALDQWKSAEPRELDLVLDGDPAMQDYWLGSTHPKIEVVEFSDFQCPHCRMQSGVMHELVETHGDVVRFIYKNYPLDPSCNARMQGGGHAMSCRAAVMARCAGAQDPKLFWKMHDALFGVESLSEEIAKRLPQEVGVDQAAFEKCLQDPQTIERVKRDIKLGDELQVSGTPTVLVNNKVLLVPTMENFEAILKLASGTPR